MVLVAKNEDSLLERQQVDCYTPNSTHGTTTLINTATAAAITSILTHGVVLRPFTPSAYEINDRAVLAQRGITPTTPTRSPDAPIPNSPSAICTPKA